MTIDQVKQTQVNLLARKALLLQEITQIDAELGKAAAIVQFAEATAPQPVNEEEGPKPSKK